MTASVYVAGRTLGAADVARGIRIRILVVDEKFEAKAGTVLLSAAEAAVLGVHRGEVVSFFHHAPVVQPARTFG